MRWDWKLSGCRHTLQVRQVAGICVLGQVASWLGVDALMLTAYPTPRALAAAMRRAEQRPGVPESHIRPPGQPPAAGANQAVASSQARREDAGAEQPPRKRPRLLDVGHATPEQQGGDEPDQAAVHPPDPSLGGWVLERCGQIRVCPPAVPAAESPAQQGASGAGARWDACASLLHQRAWGDSQGAQGDGERAGERRLELHWRVNLLECVDAPPLVLIAPAPAPDGASEAHSSVAARWVMTNPALFNLGHGGPTV